MSEIRYAQCDGLHIAYRVLEGGTKSDQDVIMVTGGLYPVESLFEEPVAARLLEGLASLGRLVLFDRRGVGLSDSVTDWDRPLVDQWADDLHAVVHAAGLEQPVVFSWHTTAIAPTYAARHPQEVGRLVIMNPMSPIRPEDSEWAADATQSLMANLDGESDWMQRVLPSRWSETGFREWSDQAGRAGASPSAAARLLAVDYDPEAFEQADRIAPQVQAPTLVLVRTPGFVPASYFARVADRIPDATVVDLSPGDMWPLGGVDEVLAEISSFVAGEARLPPPQRSLAAVLFTDLVASTERAAQAGDTEWRAVLDRHDTVIGECIGRGGGRVVKTTGDGVLATFPSATAGLRASADIRSRLAMEGLEVRAGVHVGEVESRGDDISGLAVHVAARVMSEASPGQILASSYAAGLAESGMSLQSVGSRVLKGVEGDWELFELDSV